MKIRVHIAIGAAALAAAMAAVAPDAARAQDPIEQGEVVNVESFYEALEPHGRWFEHSQYGYVWSPEVDPDWRPYTRGRWQFTEEHGWYWQAEESWGWAVFHYGRWFLDDDSGWVWVPGTEWAPAWVAWRNSDEQVGWAPLPPEAEWRSNSLNFSESYYSSPRYAAAWCFAPIAALTAYSVYRYIHPVNRNHLYIRNTRWVPSHRYDGRRIYNVGFDRRHFERLTGRSITPLRIVSVARPEGHHRAGGRFSPQPGVIHSYRPRVNATFNRVPPPRIGEQPQRDWRHGRPGITQPPFQRPDDERNRGGRRPDDRRLDDRFGRDRGRPDPLPTPGGFNPGAGGRPTVQQPPSQPPVEERNRDDRFGRDRGRPDPLPTPGGFNPGTGGRPQVTPTLPPPVPPPVTQPTQRDPRPNREGRDQRPSGNEGGRQSPQTQPARETPRVQPTQNFNQTKQPPSGGNPPSQGGQRGGGRPKQDEQPSGDGQRRRQQQ